MDEKSTTLKPKGSYLLLRGDILLHALMKKIDNFYESGYKREFKLANLKCKASNSSGVGMTKETYYEKKKGKKLKLMINCSEEK